MRFITSQNSKGPSRDWLKIVKSTQAKNKINQWFKNELQGRQHHPAEKRLLNVLLQSKEHYLKQHLKTGIYGCGDPQVWLPGLGCSTGSRRTRRTEGRSGCQQASWKLYEKQHKKEITDEKIIEAVAEIRMSKVRISKSKGGIVVKGIDDVAVRFSKCCSPVPGDEIVGFVTRGRGVSIHRTDCVNIINLSSEGACPLNRCRVAAAGECRHASAKYTAEIKVYGNNRTGLLVDVVRDAH